MTNIHCDSGHLCLVCWIKERRDAIRQWLFRRLPARWRHRILMREAMRQRRQWRELKREGSMLALLADPRSAHLERRVLRSLTSHSFPTFENVKAEWVKVGDPITFAESHRCPRCEKTLRHDKGYCPLFPDVRPPQGHEKWSRCVCLVHTCYDAAALRGVQNDRR